MLAVRIQVTKFVDDHQPGFVECELVDAHGQHWLFVEKVPVVSPTHLDASSLYPQPGVLACIERSRRPGETGREIVLIDTQQPWGVESVDHQTQFEVFADALMET